MDYSQSSPVHKTPHRPVGFIYIIPLGLVIGFFIFALVFVLRSTSGGTNSKEASPTPTVAVVQPTTVPTDTPTPTPEDVAKDDVSIMVLNGSGVSGAAGKAAKVLTDAGYTKVKTGNEDDETYKDVTIHYVSEAKAQAEDVKKTLEKTYTVDTIEAAKLTGNTDIEVIIGK